MPRSIKILGFVLVTLVAAYGCAKGPGSTGSTESSSTTTAKAQKLEEDYPRRDCRPRPVPAEADRRRRATREGTERLGAATGTDEGDRRSGKGSVEERGENSHR